MNTPGWFAEFFRSIFAALDGVGYGLLEKIFDVFFAVSTAEIFSGEVMTDFYVRMQLIFGVFMIFKLSFTVLNIIISPDNYKDKQKGASTIVVRIAVMLIMLTLIIPINIPNTDGNPLNERINENGILFGFLYQFQDSVIRENVLGKLILGSNAGSTSTGNGDELNANLDNMSDIGGMITLEIAQVFMTPTLVNEDTQITDEEVLKENAACPSELENTLHYYESSVRPTYLTDHINETCDNDEVGEVFAMQYTILGGFVFSIIMIVIVLGFTVDVAVRSIKLIILRVIAPVPIISYITPGSEKDGAFGNWVKTLTTTYLDLFIRLAVIYFGIYVIVIIKDGGLNILQTGTDWFTSGLATVFIILGILVFMKQAPKFFKDILGIKGDGHLFSGIGAALGGAALLGGLSGSVISSARTGYEEGRLNGDGVLKSGFRGVRAGVGGLVGGAYAGGKAFMTNDKKIPSSVISSMQRRNAIRAGGSTWFGRTRDSAHSMFIGGSPVDSMDAKIEGYGNFADLYKSVAAKADVDDMFEVDVGGTKHTVKDLKETYERLVNANASPRVQKIAEDQYKAAQEQLIDSVFDGTYRDFLPEDKKNGATPFADQISRDIENATKLKNSLGLNLDMSNAKAFKIASFNALDEKRNLQNRNDYKARKKNQQFNKH